MAVPWRRKVSSFFHAPSLAAQQAPVPHRNRGHRIDIRVARRWLLESDVQSLGTYFLRRGSLHSDIRNASNSPFSIHPTKSKTPPGSPPGSANYAPPAGQLHHQLPFRINLRNLSRLTSEDGSMVVALLPRIDHRRRDVLEVLDVPRREFRMRGQHDSGDHGVAHVNWAASSAAIGE